MDSKTQPSQIYITQPVNDQGIVDNTTNDEVNQNQDWGEKRAFIKLLHIGEVVSQSTTKDLPHNFEHDQRYYVGIPCSSINIEEQPKEFNVVNIDEKKKNSTLMCCKKLCFFHQL
jgi:hypothetical protein